MEDFPNINSLKKQAFARGYQEVIHKVAHLTKSANPAAWFLAAPAIGLFGGAALAAVPILASAAAGAVPLSLSFGDAAGKTLGVVEGTLEADLLGKHRELEKLRAVKRKLRGVAQAAEARAKYLASEE